MRFEFATATRIVFGPGTVREVPAAAAEMGRRALVVTRASADFKRTGIAGVPFPIHFPIHGEPTVDMVRQGTQLARDAACDLVIALGGGSTIDASKAIAALLTNGGDPLDYLEVVGQAKPLNRPSAPFIAIPTTAGTGSEVTRNAVLRSPEHRVKASLRSPYMLPSLAVVDPELTLDLPPALTASTGLDALTQLIEPYVSIRANAMTDLYCAEGMRLAASALRRAWHDGHDLAARTDMAFASLLGGFALANPRLGGGDRIAGRWDATPEDGAAWVECLCRDLEIRPLGAYGVRAADVPALADKAARASSMQANPDRKSTRLNS